MNSSKNNIQTLKYPTYFLTKKKSTKAKTANAVTAANTPIPTFNLLFSSFSTSFMLESLWVGWISGFKIDMDQSDNSFNLYSETVLNFLFEVFGIPYSLFLLDFGHFRQYNRQHKDYITVTLRNVFIYSE